MQRAIWWLCTLAMMLAFAACSAGPPFLSKPVATWILKKCAHRFSLEYYDIRIVAADGTVCDLGHTSNKYWTPINLEPLSCAWEAGEKPVAEQ